MYFKKRLTYRKKWGIKMIETKPKVEFSVMPECNCLPVIIVAAGGSTRMGGVNKQFIEITGVPVIARTLLKFQHSDAVSKIILVTRKEDIPSLQLICEKYGISKLTDIVAGGENRQASVKNGLSRLSPCDESVLIHDGARPLVEDSTIRAVADALLKYDAVTCAVKVKDTIKQISPDCKIEKTLDRASLVAVQTPQGVKVQPYLEALEKTEDISLFTDDTSIMEAAGFSAYTVEGSYKNIKITTPEDIALAEIYLKE